MGSNKGPGFNVTAWGEHLYLFGFEHTDAIVENFGIWDWSKAWKNDNVSRAAASSFYRQFKHMWPHTQLWHRSALTNHKDLLITDGIYTEEMQAAGHSILPLYELTRSLSEDEGIRSTWDDVHHLPFTNSNINNLIINSLCTDAGEFIS